ncbi:hypothetical protein, partial [Cytobacillus sp. IB215665]|uniref:hypothetical protein n=1 Tax=Cytobacillus sp. IB215665 TaxID=3097357 RepID=UPI002A0D0AC6
MKKHFKKVLTSTSKNVKLIKSLLSGSNKKCSLKTKQNKSVNVNFFKTNEQSNFIGEFDPGSGRTLAA